MKPLLRIFLIAAGFLSLALGVIGIFVPLLPTTPFLLLAAFCFLRSSKKLYDWLIHHRVFGKYIYHYLKYRAVTLKTKIGAMIFLAASLTLSIILIAKIPVTVVLLIVGVSVSIHILSLKTFDSGMEPEKDPSRFRPD